MDEQELNSRLRQAAAEGDLSALAQALADGANARADNSSALLLAAMSGHAECVELLIPVSAPKAGGSVALRWAAGNRYAQCVRLLIPVSDPLAGGSGALRSAAIEGHAECVELLLPVSEKLEEAAAEARKNGHLKVSGMIEAIIEARALSGGLGEASAGLRAKKSL